MMITINLRPGQKRKKAGAGGAAFKERLAGITSRVKDPLLAGAVALCVVVVAWLAVVFVKNQRDLTEWEPRLEQARAENKRFQTFIKQKRRQELIRDSLAAQVNTIRQIDGDRYVWPHILDEVTRALPPYTWLVEVNLAGTAAARPGAPAAPAPSDSTDTTAVVPAVRFGLTGRTVDLQAYTRFLRQLEASPWIQNVAPQTVQTVVEKERPVTAFTLVAEFIQADSAYIRTVPLSQSVR